VAIPTTVRQFQPELRYIGAQQVMPLVAVRATGVTLYLSSCGRLISGNSQPRAPAMHALHQPLFDELMAFRARCRDV
jgi:hypothetical protein